MKHFLVLMVLALGLAACNNGGTGQGVGDSLTVDPTTAQPITTEPDTVGNNHKDSLTIHQNQ